MATGDVYELVDEQEQQGQIINNVYHFLAQDNVVTAQSLADWYETNIVPDIADQQVGNLSHINIRVRNLFLASDTAENPIGVPGVLLTTDETPTFISISARFDHNLGGTRPGQKRWAGQADDRQDGGVWTAAVVTAFQAIADKLVNPLAPAIAFNHVIVDRICEAFDPAVPTRCISWRLPETQAEHNSGSVIGATVQTQVTTQNSRKWYT